MTFIPAAAYHVWDFVEEELAARGWTLDDLATRMPGDFGVNRLMLDLCAHARDEEMTDVVFDGGSAELLGQAFGINPQLFINLHNYWRNWKLSRGEPK